MGKTNIEWAHNSTNFWNWTCDKKSPGCKNCYAEAMARRYGKDFSAPPVWRERALVELRRIPDGETNFVNDMTDSFLERVPDEMIHRLFDALRSRPGVIHLLLTKRPERALSMNLS